MRRARYCGDDNNKWPRQENYGVTASHGDDGRETAAYGGDSPWWQ